MYLYTLTNQATKFERLKWPMSNHRVRGGRKKETGQNAVAPLKSQETKIQKIEAKERQNGSLYQGSTMLIYLDS